METIGTEQYFSKECMRMNVKRGDIYYADLRPVIGSEQGGVRPVLIVQNDMGNRYSPTVICAAITSRMNKADLPTHVALEANRYGIVKDSVILLEQVRTIDKSRLKEKVCHLEDSLLKKINEALRVSFSLSTYC
jgi:mRNA interferase MazF